MKNKNVKPVIICLSNQFFDLPLKTNKHLVMQKLADRGYKVIFVDPPTRFKFIKNFFKTKKFSLIDKQSENLFVYRPVNFLGFFPFTYVSNLLHVFVIKRLVRRLQSKHSNIVLWVYHFDFPRVFDLDKGLNPAVFIYDVVDDYQSFPEYSKRDITNTGIVKYFQLVDRFFKEILDQKGKSGKEWVMYREKQLAKRANLMFASHPYLYEKFKKLKKNTQYVPNAGQFDLYYKKIKGIPKELIDIKKPIVGYSGALDAYKFDVDLFLYAAKNSPEINYVLIGPMQLSDSNPKVLELKNLKNVHLVGVKTSEETAHFTQNFDAYTIPYQTNSYVQHGCFPIKFFNALSSGVPVVVSNLTAYKGFENVLYIAKSKEEYLEMIKKAVKDKSIIKAKERIKVASKNTWDDKVNKQLKAIRFYI
ncbi:hypothetical protein COV24_02005 [candidate division WWE3 bacterium CG10_big_fil_rev_8_21_14_0_10_32_10]|uniref:Glycosyl transferase family 1 domain-containing protein n=1 Tax=candidate division WWE3 bacterium CG10_big_fil_rev_8_21_14_0_10_32_10 TaxID=1975090 RepID=A0A2H0RB34_UNCKA|nr:MAG: hypothetical protein COV24_02005 [candidate division WWE3 bacterium CG10_big_fil_rev_8_21_14_0_10_32_10]